MATRMRVGRRWALMRRHHRHLRALGNPAGFALTPPTAAGSFDW